MKYFIISIFVWCVPAINSGYFIELFDGSVRPACVVERTWYKLRAIVRNEPASTFILSQLLQKAKSCRFVLNPEVRIMLRRYGLIDAQCRINDMVRSVVISSFYLDRNGLVE